MKIHITLISTYADIVIHPTLNPKDQRYDGEWWQTLAPIKVVINGSELCVPAGFITNLGSIPKFGRPILNKSGQATLGYIVHDWLYYKSDLHGGEFPYAKISRMTIDKALNRISKMSGQNMFKRYLTFMSLRVFGGFYYRKKLAGVLPIPESVLKNIEID